MLTSMAAFVAQCRPASIYRPPFEPPADSWSPYARTGIYADPSVRDALAALLLAGLKGVPTP